MDTSNQMLRLGWRAHFQTQLQLEELEDHFFGRVLQHHRSEYLVQLVDQQLTLPISENLPQLCVGDWLVFNKNLQFVRALESFSSFSRKAAGKTNEVQMIASNVDTVFIVSSLNQDFNLNRIERFLALAHEAEVQAIVVLTKKDLCKNWEDYVAQVQALDSLLIIEAINALEADSIKSLLPWCEPGQTIAVLGSSGVGKSTLINTLANQNLSSTSAIRENDSKGKHTTTARSLFQLNSGVWLMDTPGMREIQLQNCEDGVNQTFSDITELAQGCRFSDCQHHNEPGCEIRAAIQNHTLDRRRFENYQKLLKEQARNSASIEETRAAGKKTVKLHKAIQREARNSKGKEQE